MITSMAHQRIMATGFWLPCNQSSFFDHNKDRNLLANIQANRNILQEPESNLLQSSVFRRLVTVLFHKGYSLCYPVIPTGSHHSSDPEAVVFTANFPQLISPDQVTTEAKPIAWSNVSPPIQSLVCIVNASGFYAWFVVYNTNDGETGEEESSDIKQVRAGLHDHLDNMVGGAYFSHYSGSKEDADKALDDDERQQNLEYYRHELRGILTFSQINTILEGLFNSSLDLRVFFYGESEDHSITVSDVKHEYSLRNFVNFIEVPARLLNEFHLYQGDGSTSGTHTKMIDEARIIKGCLALNRKIPLIEIDPNARSHQEVAHELVHALLDKPMLAQILRQFLQGTSNGTLQELKQRIERSRRALLSEMIEITHRRFPLLQVEPPDNVPDKIEGVNEAQLRGYVMLFAAKLPIVESVRLHLADVVEEYFPKRPERKEFPYHSWCILLDAIENDVKRLEDAINQASMDRQLYEEEQIRSTEETLAEIERLRSRTEESQSLISTLTTAGLSNVIALLALFFAFHSFNPGLDLPSFFKKLVVPTFLGSGLVGQIISGAILVILVIIAYLILQGISARVIRSGRQIFRQRRNKDDRFYYEFDLHIQAPLSNQRAEQLLNGQFQLNTQKMKAIFKLPQRNSYRVERDNKDAATHKIYIETDLYLAQRRFFRNPVRLIMVYEVGFHRPTLNHSYILQDLRVVINHGTVFTPDQLQFIKETTAKYFVNHWLDKSWYIALTPRVDAFFSMNYTQEVKPKSPDNVVVAREVDPLDPTADGDPLS